MDALDRPPRLSPAEFAGSSELARLMSGADRDPEPDERVEVPERPLEILLVEDEQESDHSLGRRLEQAGHRVTSAWSGSHALHEYTRCEPDLVLLDLSQPGRNGLELLRELQLQPGHETIPVVVLTASDDPVTEVEAKLWGAREVVRKPVSPGRLLGAVRASTAEPRGNELGE